MKIHEYQAKELLRGYGVPVPRGKAAATPEEAREAAEELQGKTVVKAQIHAGGRGKGGDVKPAASPDEEDPLEVAAKNASVSYVKLDGNVGCMVNGAGLAMTTMDLIKMAGSELANFLDVGGSASAEQIEKAFRILTSDPNVKCILRQRKILRKSSIFFLDFLATACSMRNRI